MAGWDIIGYGSVTSRSPLTVNAQTQNTSAPQKTMVLDRCFISVSFASSWMIPIAFMVQVYLGRAMLSGAKFISPTWQIPRTTGIELREMRGLADKQAAARSKRFRKARAAVGQLSP